MSTVLDTQLSSYVAARQQRLTNRLAQLGLGAFVTSHPANRRYLTGFTGSAGVVLITGTTTELFTDWRYLDQAAAESPGLQVHSIDEDGLWPSLDARLLDLRADRVAFEKHHVTYAFSQEAGTRTSVEWVPTERLVEDLRQVKDDYEVTKLMASLEVAEHTFEHILGFIRPGVTERELAIEMRHHIETMGAQNQPNLPIIASGYRGAYPHGRASDKQIERGDLVLFDFGALVDGYYSDLSRTVVCGTADNKQRELYEVVRQAIAAGSSHLKAGTAGAHADHASKQPLVNAGFESAGTAVGHGLGLEIHEDPYINEAHTTPLQEAMVVTIEPGIYLSGWGGVRIEDTVLVGSERAVTLNRTTHDLIQV